MLPTEIGLRVQNSSIGGSTSRKFVSIAYLILEKLHLFISFLPFFAGEVLGFENLVYSVFEFIHGLIETAKFKSTVKKTVDQLLYYVLHYMQITEEQVQIS